jgi:hypothetical protein
MGQIMPFCEIYVTNPGWGLPILIQDFCSFLQFLQANGRIVPQLVPS